jgi:trimeric autotransporter adhesin
MAIRYLSGVNIDSNTLVVDDVNNRVGIGTASPTVALHIVTGGSTQIRLQHDSWNYWDITSAYNITNADLYFSMAGAEKFRINASGNVGIGTTSPTEKLSLSGSTATTFGLSLEPSGWNSAKHRFTVPVSGDTSMWSFNYNGSVVDSSLYATSSIQIGQGAILFSTGGTNTAPSEKMRVTSSGNVGIANSSPITKFTVGAYEGSRLPYINGTANTFNADGITVTSYNTANAGIGGGLDLTNNVYSVGSFSPLISFSSKTQSGTYNNNYAAIYGILAGDSGDGNWNSGHLVFATALAYGASEKMRITNAGNVGIGTTSPSSKLHVSSSGETTLIIDSTSAGTARINLTGAGGGAGAITSTVGGLYVYASGANPITFNTNGSERLRVESNGNVGIGTTSPGSKLDVISSSTQIADFRSTVTDGLSNIRVVNDQQTTASGTSPAAIELVGKRGSSTHGRHAWIGAEGVDGTTFRTQIKFKVRPEDSPYQWSTLPTQMVIDGNGNVGVGTTSPTQKLEVNGNIKLSSTAGATATPSFIWLGNDYSNGTTRDKLKIYLYNSGTEQYGFSVGSIGDVQYHSNSTHDFYVNNGNAVRINSSGNVGIGTTSPGEKLEVNGVAKASGFISGNFTASTQGFSIEGGDSSVTTYRFDSDRFRFFSGNFGEIVTIQESGNVGIGNTSPGFKLHIKSSGLGSYPLVVQRAANNNNIFYIYEDGSGNGTLTIENSGGGAAVSLNSNGVSYLNGGNVGIGTTSPLNPLFVSASNAADYAAFIENTNSSNGYGLVARTAHTGTSAYAFAARAAATDIFVVRADGNVGIGTTSPAQKLDVNGAIAVSGTTFVDSTRRNIYLDSFSAGGGAGIFFRDGFTYNASITAEDHNGSAADGICISGSDGISFSTGSNSKNERMRITSAGNVGIGTTSPTGKLEIAGATELLRLQTVYPIGSARGIISWYDTTDVTGRIYTIYDGTTVDMRIGALYSSGYNTSDLVTIKGNGNVGIGTTNPTTALVIQGGGTGSAAVTIQHTAASGYSGIDFFENTGTLVGSLWHANSSGVASNQNAMTLSARNSGDKVYIVAGGYDPSTSGGITVAAGNVGIGTTSPSEKLHVDGNVIVTYNNSFQGINSIGNKAILARVSPTTGIINYAEYATATNLNGFVLGSDDARVKGNIATDSLEFITNGSTQAFINSSGNVGIGTTSPSTKLHITGGFLRLDALANNANGWSVSTGTGYLSSRITTDNHSRGWGWEFTDNYVDYATPTAYFRVGYNGAVSYLNSGNFGISTTSPSYKLDVVGDSRITSGSLGVGVAPNATDGRIDASNDIVAYSTSDQRLKENVTPIESALEKVKTLTGVEFDWKEETAHVHGYHGHDVGIIAQDVQAVLPEAVRTNESGYLSVRYEKMIALLIEANKELAARVEFLEQKLKQ